MSDTLELIIFTLVAACLALAVIFRRLLYVLASLLVGIGLWHYWNTVRDSEAAALRPIADAATRVVASHYTNGEEPLAPEFIQTPGETGTGKVIVWDMRAGCLGAAHYFIPKPFRAEPGDPAMTIFLIWNTKSEQVGTYRSQDQSKAVTEAPAYRDTMEVGVVRWPEKTFLGWHSIGGANPPAVTRVSLSSNADRDRASRPVHSDTFTPLLDWIQSVENVR